MLDFRQGFVDAEKNDEDFAINAHPQGGQEEDRQALINIGVIVEFDAEGDKEDADPEANQQAQPKDDLNDDRRHHAAEGKKVFHEIFLSW